MSITANHRILHPLSDGMSVEAVYYGSGTLCISTQVGCALGCPFCASGSSGLMRNLTVQEMIDQVACTTQGGHSVRRVTLSGIGEPLHNADAVRSFLEWGGKTGLPVSLTTTGSPLALFDEFLGAAHNGLMLSLHAGTAGVHNRMIPKSGDFDGLWEILRHKWPVLSRRQRRRIGINYLLVAGINDTSPEIDALAERLKNFPEITLHLLNLNPVGGMPFSSPPPSVAARIHSALAQQGINVRRSNRWRQSLEGGCGTLVAKRNG